MSHRSVETIQRYQRARAIREGTIEVEQPARPRKPSRVAPALMLAAELTLFLAGFAAGETVRVVVSDGHSPPCVSCEVK